MSEVTGVLNSGLSDFIAFFPHKLPLLLLKEVKEGAEYGRDGEREGWKGGGRICPRR